MFAIARALSVAAALSLLGTVAPLRAQGSDVDAIKRVLRGESDAYFRRDYAAWQNAWVHDSTASGAAMGSGGYSVWLGWDQIAAAISADMKENPQPIAIKLEDLNHRIRIDGNLAFADYDQPASYPPDTTVLKSRQHRALVKRDGEWKIFSTGIYQTFTFDTRPDAIEGRIRGVAGSLYEAKKYADAIEVLKLNAQMFPKSARVYQNLGQLYEATGDIKLAIQNHEKALAIDSKNKVSSVALAKLKAPKSQ